MAKLLAYYNPLNYQLHRKINISCALHEMKNTSYILFDICGNKNEKYKKAMLGFIDKIEKDENNPLVKEFFQFLKDTKLSAALITDVSDKHRGSLYIGPKYCSEKSLYIEIEKNLQQQTDENIKVSIANFHLIFDVGKNSLVITSMHPHSSCSNCRHDKEVKGYYRAKNSKIVNDVKGNDKIICENPQALGTPGNLPKRRLSKPRVREFKINFYPNDLSLHSTPEIKKADVNEISNLPLGPISRMREEVKEKIPEKVKDLPVNTFTSEIDRLGQVISKNTVKFSLFMKQNAKESQPDNTKPKKIQIKSKKESVASVNDVIKTIGELSSIVKRNINTF